MGTVICAERIGGYIEGEFIRGFKIRERLNLDQQKNFVRTKEKVWRR